MSWRLYSCRHIGQARLWIWLWRTKTYAQLFHELRVTARGHWVRKITVAVRLLLIARCEDKEGHTDSIEFHHGSCNYALIFSYRALGCTNIEPMMIPIDFQRLSDSYYRISVTPFVAALSTAICWTVQMSCFTDSVRGRIIVDICNKKNFRLRAF